MVAGDTGQVFLTERSLATWRGAEGSGDACNSPFSPSPYPPTSCPEAHRLQGWGAPESGSPLRPAQTWLQISKRQSGGGPDTPGVLDGGERPFS